MSHKSSSFQELLPPTPSTYHFYHHDDHHILITTTAQPKSKAKRLKASQLNPTPDPKGYFVHWPYISFHNAPRTLRRGTDKKGPPICLINNSAFWKRWNLQFGEEIADAIDPRGVVGWRFRSNADNKVKNDDAALKGYKVRSWRLCAESGKQYHLDVNAQRKQGEDIDSAEFHPVHAAETLALTWTAPFSTQTRWYRFTLAGVNLLWKGTRELHTPKKWSTRLMPVHHLKLMVESPELVGEEVLLAQYSASFNRGKFGTLVVFDAEVERIFEPGLTFDMRGREEQLGQVYDVIVATAVCMVLGEAQKRQWIIEILLMLAGAGGDAAGG